MEPQVQSSTYEFGAFRLDPVGHFLARDGEPVALPPKAFDTLLILVRERGTLVAKERLLRQLWPDSYVEENNLNQYISMLRKALGENGHGDKYIETIPRLGYRFVAEVREIGSAPGPSTPPPRPWWLKPALAATTAILILLASVAVYRFVNKRRLAAGGAHPRTLAVLPLRNLKPDPDTDFLSVALADAIINRLGYVNELTVEPLASAEKYRGTDPRQAARELNVQSVLTGSYVKEGDELRVTTELVSVDKTASPWRDNIELKYDRLLTVQDRVAISVIHSLGLELQPAEVDRFKNDVPTNPAAYEFYLRALDRGFKSDFESALKLLEQSVALEPKNAMAWTELATTALAYGRLQGGTSAYVEKGWDAFHHALELDATNRFIVDEMAFQLIENNRAEEAIPLLRESLRHNSTDSFAHWYLSEAYRYGGALEQSQSEGELALRLNPKVAENNSFNTYLYTGEYRKFLASLPRDETNARTDFYRGLAFYSLNNRQEAAEEFDRAYAINPSLLHAQIGRALMDATTQRQAQGLELMKKIESAQSADGEMVYKMAQAYAQLGDMQSSLRLLRKSIELNFYPHSYFLRDPLLAPLRSSSEYSTTMELAHQRQSAFLKRFF